MYRTKYQARPYPFNLLEALNELNSIIPTTYDDLPNDFMGSIAYVYYEKLTQRERTVLDFRFKKNKSLYETALSVGCVSAERIRQIEERALSKIARSTTAYYLIYGVKFLIGNGVKDLSPQPEGNKISRTRGMESEHLIKRVAANYDDIGEIPVHLLGFSKYISNCLNRNGIIKTKDLFELETVDYLRTIKGIGPVSMYKIRSVVDILKTIIDSRNSPNLGNAHPIEELNLSTRSYNAIVRSGVVSVNDILGWSDEDFLSKRCFGKACLQEVREKLEKFKEENEI